MYRFLLKPRWILSHLFVLAVVIAMVNMGLWQLRRLDEKRARNAEIVAAQHETPVALSALLPPLGQVTPADVTAAQYRVVLVSGTYRAEQQVVIPNRTHAGSPGFWVITPLQLADGSAVAINRGWIPYTYTPDPATWGDFAPPTGSVVVQGMVRVPQTRSNSIAGSPSDPSAGVVRELARVDVARLDQQVDETLWPLYLDLQAQQPAPGDLPIVVDAPELSEGPHLGYAVQWFAFSALTLVVYPLLLRRHARRRLYAPEAASEVTER